jgi:cyanophycinase
MSHSIIRKLVFYLIMISAISTAQNKGHLVIIGGGDKPRYVLQKFLDFAGGETANIVVIPNASSDPKGSAEYNVNEFKKLGCKNISYLLFTRKDVDTVSNVETVRKATGIFFSGGDQVFLTRDLLGTELMNEIRNVYARGGVISGTSAGAAVMSEVMITGNELKNKDTTDIFKTIETGNVQHLEGFGFITNAIIDQHFIKRKRLNRLFSMVLEHPKLVGVGIDEETSIIVNPDETFEVLGENQVVILNATQAASIREGKKGILAGENIRVDILLSGDKYDLKSRKILH